MTDVRGATPGTIRRRLLYRLLTHRRLSGQRSVGYYSRSQSYAIKLEAVYHGTGILSTVAGGVLASPLCQRLYQPRAQSVVSCVALLLNRQSSCPYRHDDDTRHLHHGAFSSVPRALQASHAIIAGAAGTTRSLLRCDARSAKFHHIGDDCQTTGVLCETGWLLAAVRRRIGWVWHPVAGRWAWPLPGSIVTNDTGINGTPRSAGGRPGARVIGTTKLSGTEQRKIVAPHMVCHDPCRECQRAVVASRPPHAAPSRSRHGSSPAAARLVPSNHIQSVDLSTGSADPARTRSHAGTVRR